MVKPRIASLIRETDFLSRGARNFSASFEYRIIKTVHPMFGNGAGQPPAPFSCRLLSQAFY